MPDPITGVTQPTTETTTTTTTETAPAGATAPAPSKKEEQTTQTQTTQQTATKPLPQDEVQKRIDRMYARLQEERRQRLAAENQLKLRQQVTTKPTDDEDGGEAQPEVKPQLTEEDVQRAAEQAIERRERDARFRASETKVFLDHPEALDANGNFNMADPWVKRYIEIGKQNPMLAMMENGPELAAAAVDKEMGVDFKKGRTTEAQRAAQTEHSFTTTSTTAPAPSGTAVVLNDAEKKVARRMGLSDADYAKQRGSNKVVQKSWEVGGR